MKINHRLSISPAPPRTIGRLLLAGAICWSGAPLFAQNQPPAPVPQSQPGSQALLTQDDLKDMVGPIALYPDALIGLILPASTVPSDVVLGARFVDSKGDPSQAGNQPWDDSVKSLVYYPDVLSWMNENLEWTASLGEAFMDQPADVMNAIQSLRAQARASGALTDTPQQRVVVQQETVRIIPADPEVIYVPQYDPEVIFVDNYAPSYTPFITFGIGFAVGSWLNYDCDWGNRYVSRGDWNRGGWDRNRWDRGGDVNVNNVNINNTNINVVNINNAKRWNPSNRSVRQLEQRQRNGGGNARFTTAEARTAREMIRTERRNNNGKLPANALAAARRDNLPTPRKLELREAANNRAVKPQDRTNRNDTAENLAEARRARDNATPNRPVVENRRKTPSEAPRVNGQLDAARQAQREETRRNASETRQNVRQQAEDRQVERPNQMPVRAPRVDDADRPSQRPSVNERQENRQAAQENRQEARQERQEVRQERPQQRQEVRQQQQQQRQEARPQQQRQRQEDRSVNKPQQRERTERPQQQQRQENRQQRQENRQERPQQRQEARQERQENRPQQQKKASSEKKSDDKGEGKKKKND
jgi:hypothetical protein